MKTNKQRAEIVLEKSKQIENQNLNQTQPLQKTFSKKQKTIFATCIISFVCVIASVFVLVFSLGGANNFDINHMFIANFENYTALGAGYFENSNSGAVYADEDTPSKQYLLGLTQDGKIEKIKITTQEGDEIIEQTWELSNFRAFSNYSIACFRYHDNTTPLGEFFGNYDTERTYVIDNKTGKFFHSKIYHTSVLQLQIKPIFMTAIKVKPNFLFGVEQQMRTMNFIRYINLKLLVEI